MEGGDKMGLLVQDCPRCDSSAITFDVIAELFIDVRYDWVRSYEIFCICRHCRRSTTFLVKLTDYDMHDDFREPESLVRFPGSLNRHFGVEGYISLIDMASVAPPEHVPETVAAVFNEAAACLKVECFNAAGTMFRLCVDMVTRPLLPDPQDTTATQPNNKERRDLGLRLPWLFANSRLPRELEELAACIREDGNDGAHAGTLNEEDAEDLLDFTIALLERIYTEPKRLALAKERRTARRTKN
jgi:hypothetical protein